MIHILKYHFMTAAAVAGLVVPCVPLQAQETAPADTLRQDGKLQMPMP